MSPTWFSGGPEPVVPIPLRSRMEIRSQAEQTGPPAEFGNMILGSDTVRLHCAGRKGAGKSPRAPAPPRDKGSARRPSEGWSGPVFSQEVTTGMRRRPLVVGCGTASRAVPHTHTRSNDCRTCQQVLGRRLMQTLPC